MKPVLSISETSNTYQHSFDWIIQIVDLHIVITSTLLLLLSLLWSYVERTKLLGPCSCSMSILRHMDTRLGTGLDLWSASWEPGSQGTIPRYSKNLHTSHIVALAKHYKHRSAILSKFRRTVCRLHLSPNVMIACNRQASSFSTISPSFLSSEASFYWRHGET